MRKAQGMSINVIIVAAIALIILIVLIVIFSGRIGLFNRGLNTCGGYCAANGVCEAGDVGVPTSDCRDSSGRVDQGDGVCCLRTSEAT